MILQGNLSCISFDAWKSCLFDRNNDNISVSPLLALKTKAKYFPLRLLAFPFSFKNEEATQFEDKTGTYHIKIRGNLQKITRHTISLLTGFLWTIVLLVALIPLGGHILCIIIGKAYGMSLINFIDAAKANGFNDWDRIAMLIAVQSIAVIIPLKLFCMSNLANKIQKLVSYFDEDLRNLTTQGMVSD